jgi:outer membrane protein assembly factor BamD (BamD/ComL family)
MATKPKTSESTAPVMDASLESMLSQALEQFTAGKLKDAAKGFEALQVEAIKREDFRLGLTALGYLKAIQAREAEQGQQAVQAPELRAQLELNHQDPDAALVQVEEGLKTHPDHAGLHYVKALALAQLDQAQASADALAKAISLDAGLVFQFRLDADFDGFRHTAPFAVFNRG